MLRLKNIIKKYKVADQEFLALKGINLSFRKSEFVSVLGPSGCGKTTTLNIIGGLDKYSDGDLFINGRSTKEFNDHDWDVYRNQKVGFVFQSYNLIPHQTILGNVELSLTIAGISKSERQERAKKALDRVGLKDLYHKKPNQLSGGQCQRVAIARALVNEPEILLADEPTGALDTQTSIQIMELIKEISSEKLVIMVTHNPELAEKYSSRIIRLLDGNVVSDSKPMTEEEEIAEVLETKQEEDSKENEILTSLDEKEKIKYKKNKTKNRAKMSYKTAFALSGNNLASKLKRTVMVMLAGSIGIVGVTTVLSVSNGVTNYVDDMQNDMLSGNPLTISQSGYDLNALMSASSKKTQQSALKKGDYVNVNSMIEYLVENADSLSNILYTNEITQDYVDYIKAMPSDYYAAMSFDYGLNLSNNIYTGFTRDTATSSKNMSITAITDTYSALLGHTDYGDYSSLISMFSNSLSQAVSDSDYLLTQYNVVSGSVATKKDEIMLVVDSDSAVTDLALAQLGYYTQEEFFELIYKSTDSSGNYDSSLYKNNFSYSELLGKGFTYYPNDDIFTRTTNPYTPFSYNPNEDSTWNDGLELKVVGILEPKEGISYGALSAGFYYTEELSKYAIESNINSEIINYLNLIGQESFTSGLLNDQVTGLTYTLDYSYKANKLANYEDFSETKFLGSVSEAAVLGGMMGGASSQSYYTLSSRELGGSDIASTISIYPIDFDNKDLVTDYLDLWNSDNVIIVNGKELAKEARAEMKYSDQLELVITLINGMINMITIALVAFTALSLVVSTVMVGIITYVSVVERVKEIGVIRSLGGRKKDVSHLFSAETFIIGLSSGVIGVAISYLITLVLNLGLKGVLGFNIASLPISVALVMILISVLLTTISGILPAKSAAKKDPVTALRSE